MHKREKKGPEQKLEPKPSPGRKPRKTLGETPKRRKVRGEKLMRKREAQARSRFCVHENRTDLAFGDSNKPSKNIRVWGRRGTSLLPKGYGLKKKKRSERPARETEVLK